MNFSDYLSSLRLTSRDNQSTDGICLHQQYNEGQSDIWTDYSNKYKSLHFVIITYNQFMFYFQKYVVVG